ncbi:MAG: hypothetical protein LBI05_08125 [Planctomycetaceae bacterium]|jgi:hypothetical protein|nr:hypothetical protein [Planctomycetaceae bacterium]
MRVHFSSVITLFVALLFVSGTVGCHHTGGDWYKVSSYTFSNPFDKDKDGLAAKKGGQAPPFSSGALATVKPSTDSKPVVGLSTPPGGYSDGNRADSSIITGLSAGAAGTVSTTPPEHWGQQNLAAQQGSPNQYNGYPVTEPSQYSPYADYTYPGSTPSPHQASAPPQYQPAPSQNPYQMPQETGQYANGQTQYGNQYGNEYNAQSGAYLQTSAHATQQLANPSMNSVPGNAYGTAGQPGSSYAPYGAQQNDPYASIPQQSSAALSPTPSYGGQPGPVSYPSEGDLTASPYQPYPPPPSAGGYNYSY